jgi:hypothetical protein
MHPDLPNGWFHWILSIRVTGYALMVPLKFRLECRCYEGMGKGKVKVPLHIVQAYRGSWGIAPRILTRHYVSSIGELHAPTDLPPKKFPGAHSVGSWVSPRAGLDVSEKRQISAASGNLTPDRSAHASYSLETILSYFAKFVGSRYSWCVCHSGG